MQNLTDKHLIQLSEISYKNFQESLKDQKTCLPDHLQQWDIETWEKAISIFFPFFERKLEENIDQLSKSTLFGMHAEYLNLKCLLGIAGLFFLLKKHYFDRLSSACKKLWINIITADVNALTSSSIPPHQLFSWFDNDPFKVSEKCAPSPCAFVNKNSVLSRALFQSIQNTFEKNITKERDLKRDEYGRTLLHYAAALGITDVCLSFSSKAYLNKDDRGRTPIEYAICFRQEECIIHLLSSEKISGVLIESFGVNLIKLAIDYYLFDVIAVLIEQESILKGMMTNNNEVFTEIARLGQHTLLKKLRNHPEIINLIKISGKETLDALVVGACVDTLTFLFEQHKIVLSDYNAVRLAIFHNQLPILQLFDKKFSSIEGYFKECPVEALDCLISAANPEVCVYLLQNNEVKKQLLLAKNRVIYQLIDEKRFDLLPALLSHELLDLNTKIYPISSPRLNEDLFHEIQQNHIVPKRPIIYILIQRMLTSSEARKALIFCLMRRGAYIHSNSIEIPHLEEFEEKFKEASQFIHLMQVIFNKKLDKYEDSLKIKFSYCLQRLGQFSEKSSQNGLRQKLKDHVELALCENELLKKIIARSAQIKEMAFIFFLSMLRVGKTNPNMRIPSYLKKMIFLNSIGITSDSSAAVEILDHNSVEKILMKL